MAGREDLSPSEVISFGPFRLFPAQRFLEKAGTPINLRGFALDILIILVSRPGKLVTKRELLDQVWTDTTVGEATLRFHVSALRRALGDGQGGARYVTNVPGRGYCFVAPLSRTTASTGTTALDDNAGLPHNLPTRTGRIIGRDAVIQTTATQLLGQRLVTVVGPAESGRRRSLSLWPMCSLPTFGILFSLLISHLSQIRFSSRARSHPCSDSLSSRKTHFPLSLRFFAISGR
jgi:DNA-binding winged helix-turn-helix (wHTH) protein